MENHNKRRGEEWEDCGQCGEYHPQGYRGECRDDRFRSPVFDPWNLPARERQKLRFGKLGK